MLRLARRPRKRLDLSPSLGDSLGFVYPFDHEMRPTVRLTVSPRIPKNLEEPHSSVGDTTAVTPSGTGRNRFGAGRSRRRRALCRK